MSLLAQPKQEQLMSISSQMAASFEVLYVCLQPFVLEEWLWKQKKSSLNIHPKERYQCKEGLQAGVPGALMGPPATAMWILVSKDGWPTAKYSVRKHLQSKRKLLIHLVFDIEKVEDIYIWWGETPTLQLSYCLSVQVLAVQLETQNCQKDFFWAGQDGERCQKLPTNALLIIVIITTVGIIKLSFNLHRIL